MFSQTFLPNLVCILNSDRPTFPRSDHTRRLPTMFWTWPFGSLLFENETSDARDHCANERSSSPLTRPPRLKGLELSSFVLSPASIPITSACSLRGREGTRKGCPRTLPPTANLVLLTNYLTVAFLSYLRLSIYMAVVSVAIVLSFHLKDRPSALELRMARPLGATFWALSVCCLFLGVGNYVSKSLLWPCPTKCLNSLGPADQNDPPLTFRVSRDGKQVRQESRHCPDGVEDAVGA